jgi:hypothetical protein
VACGAHGVTGPANSSVVVEGNDQGVRQVLWQHVADRFAVVRV